ncbi:MAG: electron transfer flavoprotein subunit alpha/FixB family protein [Candidatus Bathyarchaeia archaeon]
MAKDVLVYSENSDLFLELTAGAQGIARGLQGNVLGVLMGPNATSDAERFTTGGSDQLLTVTDGSIEVFDSEACAGVLAEIVQQRQPELVMIGSTIRGKELAGRLAVRLDVGCVTEVVEIRTDPKLTLRRLAYGGIAVATEKISTTPKIVAVRPGVYARTRRPEKSSIQSLTVKIPPTRLTLKERKPLEVGAVKLEDAEVVAVAGRGVSKKEDLELVRGLAERLGGQVGVTRPLSADYGWAPVWVGISGIPVKPKLYIAFGVSGQIQHIAGIRESKTIVAVNSDPEAPIFKAADYGIVGDLYRVIPAFIKELESLK